MVAGGWWQWVSKGGWWLSGGGCGNGCGSVGLAMVAWQCLVVFVVVRVSLAGGFGFGLAVSDGVCCAESGFGSGFLTVGVGLVVVADGSGCDSGFWFLQWFSNDGWWLVVV